MVHAKEFSVLAQYKESNLEPCDIRIVGPKCSLSISGHQALQNAYELASIMNKGVSYEQQGYKGKRSELSGQT